METEMSSLEMHFMLRELKQIEGSKVEKIYQWNRDEFIFKLHNKSGKYNLRIKLPRISNFKDR
jgi:predicted ribosome quality control (RQC) complex YloA/Tae2 family protein